MTALREKKITIDDAEGIIFRPCNAIYWKGKSGMKDIQDLIMSCCEIEDVASLVPKSLASCLDDLIKRTLSLLETEESHGRIMDGGFIKER